MVYSCYVFMTGSTCTVHCIFCQGFIIIRIFHGISIKLKDFDYPFQQIIEKFMSLYWQKGNQYALFWTPNAYGDMLMLIFTLRLLFQCVFNHFQCAKSVKLHLYTSYLICTSDSICISGQKKKNMFVSSDMSKNIRVGRSEKSFFLFFIFF